MHAQYLPTMDGKQADAAAQQPLLPPPPPRAEQKESLLRRVLAFLAAILVAVHFALTAYSARRHPGDLAFVLAAYAMLATLFRCVALFETLAAGDGVPGAGEARGRLRVCVWALSTVLTVLFSARVAPIMAPPLNLVVFALALLVAAGGFLLLFVADSGPPGRARNATLTASMAARV